VAAAPIVILLYLLALHPSKTGHLGLHLGIAAHKAAGLALVAALLVARFGFHMPAKTAGMAAGFGAVYGLFPIGWIIIGAMFLYTITQITGRFEVLKSSVAAVSDDRRIQAVLIAFSFGAFIEGCAGFGCPVAISGALMIGLGFKPFQAAVLCLIANTAPVAWGSLGIPIYSLSTVTGIEPMLLSKMAARQLPFFSLIVPVWMTAVQVRMDGRPWRDVWGIWPVLLVAGGSFAATQFVVGNYVNYQLVDILGGLVSMGATALFCRIWRPGAGAAGRHSMGELVMAWLPWGLLTVFVFLCGYPRVKDRLNALPHTVINLEVRHVHGVVHRMPPVVASKTIDKAIYSIGWLTAAGTAILITAVVTGLVYGLSARQWLMAIMMTGSRLRLPLLTISLILAMGFVTKYSGMDAVLGLAFTHTGRFYPFFAAMLGWLGVALTGSDTSSNIMFGSMQKITAQQLGLSPVLIVTSNSTGGVMGKMIDAQSIVVATAACYEDRQEGKHAVGPIFRAVLPHSIALAMLMGVLVMLQAYVFRWMIPVP
jgi:lactate permease